MRSLILILLVLGACASDAAPASPEPAPVAAAEPAAEGHRSDIDVAGLVEKRAAGAVLIDVRSPEEYAAGHVPGAILLPKEEALPTSPVLAGHPKDEPLYVICKSGRRSAEVADQLAMNGYTTVNVTGGTSAWIDAGLPVEK